MASYKTLSWAKKNTQKWAKSFAFAIKFLPKSLRPHFYILYVFCRQTDQVVDSLVAETKTKEELLSNLKIWEEVLIFYYTQNKTNTDISNKNSLLQTFLDIFGEQNLNLIQDTAMLMCNKEMPISLAQDLIKGMRMDLNISYYKYWWQLEQYCYLVAGVVGKMLCYLLNVKDDVALACADSLGRAMQLTNITRDINEDWSRGRCYIPEELLLKYGYAYPGLDEKLLNRGFIQVLQTVTNIAINKYKQALAGLIYLPKQVAFAILVAANIYGQILIQVKNINYQVFTLRATTTKTQKLKILIYTTIFRRSIFL